MAESRWKDHIIANRNLASHSLTPATQSSIAVLSPRLSKKRARAPAKWNTPRWRSGS